MSFDALTMAAVADELRETIVGGRVQGVFLPAPLAIGLEVYAHRTVRYLFASAHPQHARVHLTPGKLTRGTEQVTPLLLLMRKYVRDGRLVAIEQPCLERTLTLIITKAAPVDKGDSQPFSTTRLIIEVMGRYSNIVLVDDDGMVMEAVKHITPDVNRYRVVLPRHAYVPPPPQSKEDPGGCSPAAIGKVLYASAQERGWQVLVRSYMGVSPLLAREAVFRAAGSAEAIAADIPHEPLAAALGELLSGLHSHRWLPCFAATENEVLAFAPYVLTQFGKRARATDSISSAIHTYYAAETVASDYQGLKRELQKKLEELRARIQRRKESLDAQQAAAAQANDLRTKGQLILAHASLVTPGQSELLVEAQPTQEPIRIILDPRLSAVENAQSYFRRYQQARDALRSLPPLLEEASLQLAYLDQLALDLEVASTAPELAEVRQEVEEAAGRHRQTESQRTRPSPPRGRLPPLRYTSSDGFQIVVGRNARQNDYVTFDLASPADVWLHARDVPGSHVIIRAAGRGLTPQALQEAAQLAAYHSAARQASTVLVDYTLRRFVRRARSGAAGQVTYVKEQTVSVRPGQPCQPHLDR